MEGNTKTIIGILLIIAIVAGGIFAFSGSDDDDSTEESTTTTSQNETTTEPESTEAEPTSNIVELAQATDSLSTLVAAVVEAELVETLSGAGPFTVFAPTDDAFAALLADLGVTAEELLARDDLGSILTYHVVAGEVLAADLSEGQVVETVNGETLTVSLEGGATLTDANGNVANIIATDVDASNGVVHLIDAVVLP